MKNNREIAWSAPKPDAINTWQETMKSVPEFGDGGVEQQEEALSPEIIKSPQKISEQLEKMGVDPKIINNPALPRILAHIIRRYDIAHAIPQTLQGENINEHSMEFSGAIGQAQDIKRGTTKIRFEATPTGEIHILNGRTELENVDRNDGSKILYNDCQDFVIKLLQDKETLEVAQTETFESFWRKERKQKESSKSVGLSTDVSHYDVNGIETMREMEEHTTYHFEAEYDGDTWHKIIDTAFRHADIADYSGGRPTYVDFRIRYPGSIFSSDLQSFLHVYRNPDGKTARVRGKRNDGTRFKADDVALNGEHGYNDLVINDAVIGLL